MTKMNTLNLQTTTLIPDPCSLIPAKKHYGFTEEELDFIINYDIKYRMGTELEGDNE